MGIYNGKAGTTTYPGAAPNNWGIVGGFGEGGDGAAPASGVGQAKTGGGGGGAGYYGGSGGGSGAAYPSSVTYYGGGGGGGSNYNNTTYVSNFVVDKGKIDPNSGDAYEGNGRVILDIRYYGTEPAPEPEPEPDPEPDPQTEQEKET